MRRFPIFATSALCLLWPLTAPADGPKDKKTDDVPLLRELSAKGVKEQERGRPTEPTVIKSAKELAKVIPDKEDQARVNKEVKWEKQFVLAFAWGGSGGDKLSTEIKKDKDGKELVVFRYTPGSTFDLRRHTRLYALRQGATWKFEK